jgi:hypothetical protein
MEPVRFNSSIDMKFERGPDHASHGFMESVGYYYLAQPGRAASRVGIAINRQAPLDPVSTATIMMELLNHERIGDYRGAHDYIDTYLERETQFPFAPLLRLRQIAYRERLSGFDAVRPQYEEMTAPGMQTAAREQAEAALWLHREPGNALLFSYCNADVKIYLDGQLVGRYDDPQKVFLARVTVEPGRHVLAIEARQKQPPHWVQLCLRTAGGDIVTKPSWKWAFNPAGNWSALDFDDSGWKPCGGTGVKGPPDDPFVWIEPNGFVDAQSQAVGLRAPAEWPAADAFAVYRYAFDTP